MKLTKIIGLAAILLSANMANAATYEIHLNKYGATYTTKIDDLRHQSAHRGNDCVGTVIGSCNPYTTDRYLFKNKLYPSIKEVINVAHAHFATLPGSNVNISSIAVPLSSSSTVLEDKVEIAYDELVHAYGKIEAKAFFDKVHTTAKSNANVRLNQLKNHISWDVDYVNYPNMTYEEAINLYAQARISELNDYHYQTNAYGQSRIRLVNYDNSYFGDWIYANNVTDLIVGLAEETFGEGFKQGYENGYQEGYEDGYVDGYIDGFRDGLAQ